EALVLLDEAHPAHVAGEVEDPLGVPARLLARLLVVEVQPDILHARETLVPLVVGLDVHRPDLLVALTEQVGDKMSADETTSAGDDDDVVLHEGVPAGRGSSAAVCRGAIRRVSDMVEQAGMAGAGNCGLASKSRTIPRKASVVRIIPKAGSGAIGIGSWKP